MTVELSPRTLEICREHWMPMRTRCDRCPLHLPCTTRVVPLTLTTVGQYVEAINAASEQVSV